MDGRIEKISADIMKYCKSVTSVRLRYLSAAVASLDTIPTADDLLSLPFGVDGDILYYNPVSVIKAFEEGTELPSRAYLHSLLHCVFRHAFVGDTDRDLWDISSDIAVESIINSLGIFGMTPISERETALSAEIKTKVGDLTAEKIYSYLKKSGDEKALAEYKGVFTSDSHFLWHITEEEKKKYSDKAKENNKAEGENERKSPEGRPEKKDKNGDGTGKGKNIPTGKSGEDKWKKISERIKEDLETFSKKYGEAAGNLLLNIDSVNREKYDYSVFLRRFAINGEILKTSPEEFDYVYYNYGLSLYKNMPLVEPLEYRDAKKIKEFVIAIDTSESVTDKTVKSFVSKTFSILKTAETFSDRVNVHIIECDAEIKKDVKIELASDLEKYISGLEIKGRGGTDFCPVFEYTDGLINTGELKNLQGLIYFTDGMGKFPSKPPKYKTAFVYPFGAKVNPEMPSWAIGLNLEEGEI